MKDKEIILSGQFKKDLKRYKHKPRMIEDLEFVLDYLREERPLPKEYCAHILSGVYKGYMECHIQGDFLLIWFDETENIIKLVRLGTHSELFG